VADKSPGPKINLIHCAPLLQTNFPDANVFPNSRARQSLEHGPFQGVRLRKVLKACADRSDRNPSPFEQDSTSRHLGGLSRQVSKRSKPNLIPWIGRVRDSAYGLVISVRNFGRSAATFAFIAVSAALSGLGAGVVRVVTGTSTARKNSSCPAGEQMHSNRAGSLEAFVKQGQDAIVPTRRLPANDLPLGRSGRDHPPQNQRPGCAVRRSRGRRIHRIRPRGLIGPAGQLPQLCNAALHN
jgi:hypothetical protein